MLVLGFETLNLKSCELNLYILRLYYNIISYSSNNYILYIYIYIYMSDPSTNISTGGWDRSGFRRRENIVRVNMVLAEYNQIQTWLSKVCLLFAI